MVVVSTPANDKNHDNEVDDDKEEDSLKSESYSEYIHKLVTNLAVPKQRYSALQKLQDELPEQQQQLQGEKSSSGSTREKRNPILHTEPRNYIKLRPQKEVVSTTSPSSSKDNNDNDKSNKNSTASVEEHCLHLPSFKWNLFKRGYTLGMWLNVQEIHGNCTFYQFRQSKYGGIGICCTINPCSSNSSNSAEEDYYQVTIYTLPFSHKRGQYIRSKITFLKNTWQFWCISHDNPYNHLYIHRPKMHFSINGVLQFTAELVYPTATSSSVSHAQQENSEDIIMEENILLGGSSFEGSISQVLLWKEAFSSAPDFLSGYIGEMGPNVVHQVIIPSIPINRDAMYHDYAHKKRRSEMGIGIPSVLHNNHTMMLSKSEGKLHFRFIPKCCTNGVITLEDVVLEGDLKNCPKLGVIQPLLQKRNSDVCSIVDAYVQQDGEDRTVELYNTEYNFSHTFYCVGGLHSTLLPLFEALIKPPGCKYKLQTKLLKIHLERKKTFDYNFYLDNVLSFLATCLQSSIHLREEAVQTGFCSHLAYLLSQSLLDESIMHSRMPKQFSESLGKGLLALFDACCGGSIINSSSTTPPSDSSAAVNANTTRTWETPSSSSIYLRRSSDLALQFLHTFVFPLSLYKNYPNIISKLLSSFVHKYKYMGEFIMKHVSIQYILDQMKFYSSSSSGVKGNDNNIGKESIFSFFHFLMLSSLRHSEFCERDVTTTIINLTICPLGSVTSYVIFHAFAKIVDSGDVDVMIKLGRFLILCEFHSIIAPVLLSRSVCLFLDEEEEHESVSSTLKFKNDGDSAYDWKSNWRTAFLLFVWLTSVSSVEGEMASQHFGNLLYKSAVSGTLQDCMHKEDFIDVLLPSNTNTMDRIKSLLPLLPSIFILLKQDLELGWSCQLLSKMCYFFQRFRTQLSTTKILKEYVPIFVLLFCIIYYYNDNVNDSSSALEEDTTLIQETCLESILDLLSNLILTCMRNGKDCSYDVWANINTSLHFILQEILIDNHQEDSSEAVEKAKKFVLSKICNVVLKAISSVERVSTLANTSSSDKKNASRRKEPPMSWNIDLAQGVSRFVIFMEEKELHKEYIGLIPGLIKVLTIAREDLGWMQSLPQQQAASNRHIDPSTSEANLVAPEDKPQLQRDLRGENHMRGGLIRQRSSSLLKKEKSMRLSNTSISTPTGTTVSEANNSSTYLLPILQPCLRMVLNSIEDMSVQTIHHSLLMTEMKLTLSAALMGLSFPHARDTGLEALSSVRKALLLLEDEELKSSYLELVLFTANELHARYKTERLMKFSAESSVAMKEQEVFENMVLGSDFPKQRIGNKSINDDDFITTIHPMGSADCSNNASTSKQPKSAAKLGWNQYSGLGLALDSACLSNIDNMEKDDSSISADKIENQASPLATQNLFLLLESYLNKWDEHLIQEIEECSSISMFSLDDSHVGSESYGGYVSSIFQKSNNQSLGVTITPTVMSSNSSDNIGEIIEHYIEIVSLERNRMENVKLNVMETVRTETAKVVEYNFWKIYRENCLPGEDVEEWERSVLQDGGRDAFSRFVTMPCKPEFERFLPDHLNPGNRQPEQRQNRTVEDEFQLSCDLIGKIKIKDITKERSIPFDESTTFDDDDDDDGTMLDFPQPLSSSSSSGEEEVVTEINQSMVAEEETLSTGSDTNAKSSAATTATSTISEKKNISENVAPLDYHVQPYPISSFSLPPDIPSVSSQTTTSTHSIFSTNIDSYFDNCLHVRPEGSRKGVLFLTSSYILLEYESNVFEGDSTVKCEGVNFCKWSIAELSHVYLRRYRLRDSALELFFLPSGGSSSYATSSSAFFDFGAGAIGNKKRDGVANAILKRAPHQCAKQWPKESSHFLGESLNKITLHWCCGNLSNFDYLMEINILSGRSFNDLCQYPIFPFVLSNYHTDEIPDFNDKSNYRDMTKPMGALNEDRLKDFIERFETFIDPTIPPFMYGSHYSTSAGVVLHFLTRLHPYANLHRQLQSGHFDVADRLFSHVQRTYEMCTGASAAEVKELTPEWYCNPSFLRNTNEFFLGRSQDGDLLGDVVLPPWAKGSPEKFVEVMRVALESEICTAMLPHWIDLIFGYKQQGPESIKAHNVFFYLTYYGTIDVASIEDEGLRIATELQIAHFGQCPMQLFFFPHIDKLPLTSPKFKYSLNHVWEGHGKHFEEAKLCDWLHLPSPPPAGKNLMVVRICGSDKIVSVDENGIFHFIKWMWKPDEITEDDDDQKFSEPDQGCFVAQRELLNFKTVPRLAYTPPDAENNVESRIAVAISRTMFTSQTLLLVLSDGDGKGALALQFLDPSKNIIKGVAIIPSVHSSRITCIAMDTMGSVSYQSHFSGGGGVGGELAILGSEDGSATLWRFISSHYLPLRPRLRLRGHHGSAIISVSISASFNICATISKTRCCLFHLGNGQLLRSFSPIPGSSFGNMSCLSENGYVILLCLLQNSTSVVTMFSLEGVLVGTKELINAPRKITAVQKNVISVCSSDGIILLLLSSLNPLQEIENWYFSKGAYDIDIGPYPKQAVAVMASSSGSIVIHALPGITLFSEENRKIAVGTAVGHALAKPAQKIKSAVGNVMNKIHKGVEENTRNATSGGASGSGNGGNSSGGLGGFFRDAFRKPGSNN